VQIIEVTEIAGTRAAVHSFGHPDTPLRFVVVPMVHIAEAAFYERVEAMVTGCDLVVAEGVGFDPGRDPAKRDRDRDRDDSGSTRQRSRRTSARRRTPIARRRRPRHGRPRGRLRSAITLGALTATYRWLNLGGRFGLTVQDSDFDDLGVPVVNPDLSTSAFGRTWRQGVPLLTTLLVVVVAPVYAIGMGLFGTRRFIARNLAMDDLPATRNAFTSDRGQAVIDVVVKQRDRPLLEALTKIHDERAHEPITVAVVWGAAHVPAVVTGLHTLGYRHRDAEWLTVFAVNT
jgi:hypothetical protein